MNCSFNIRYKPKTTRSFTKSDLTVYDSASNTTLNALTIYGMSEVVDGSIKSAGEGYAVVDLGALNWAKDGTYQGRFIVSLPDALFTGAPQNALCQKYKCYTQGSWMNAPNGYFSLGQQIISIGVPALCIHDDSYTDATAFKNSLNGVLLCYQIADPTQGNTIAVKTDNGSGIDGTMATFTTGTPLRATLDGTVKDEMHYNGITGEVITRCEIVNDEVVPLATPITTPLTQAENDSIAGLKTFEPQTHAQNNAQTKMTVDYTIKVPTI